MVPSGLELLSPAWLPLYQDHSEELFFSSLVLFACVSSLCLHSVQHATWGHSGCMVADEASPLLRHHPAISTRLSPRHCVADLLCKPPFPRAPERQGEHCFLLILYLQTQWNESSVILPLRCGPIWRTITACSILSR